MIVPLTTEEVLALPAAVPLQAAGRAFGMGRTKSYELAKAGEFPCRVLPLGPKFVVPKTEILAALGLEQTAAAGEIADVA
jgi:predicted DNA-binding transcriptional regulator AlpA